MTMIATGEWVRKARMAAGLTAAQLASKVGLSLNHVQCIEAGSRLPSPAAMDAIQEALDIWLENVSFDTGELVAELTADVAEFGVDRDCWLIYKPIGHFVCFTDYQPIVPEMPLRKEELQPDERAIVATYGEALEWLKGQDSIF